MCSLTLNQTFEKQLKDLNDDGKMIERKLKGMAHEADVDKPSLLDAPDTNITRYSGDLKTIRKRSFGRHRIYYIGFHTQCSYKAIFIKEFKKKGVDDEDLDSFKNKLIKALTTPDSRVIPKEKDEIAEKTVSQS